jgi:hypothetical protein
LIEQSVDDGDGDEAMASAVKYFTPCHFLCVFNYACLILRV